MRYEYDKLFRSTTKFCNRFALSGHKEGSKAFARYRTIDDDMKKELIDLLD